MENIVLDFLLELCGKYIIAIANKTGETKKFHEFSMQPKVEEYIVTVVDETGVEVKKKIEI